MTLASIGADQAAWMAAVHAESFDRPWDAAAFADYLARPEVVALASGWDGFILIQRVLDEGEVLTLAVRAARRRHGVGRALVDEAADVLGAEGVAALHLEVAEDNPAALALYAATGFEAVGAGRATTRVRGDCGSTHGCCGGA